MFCPNCGTKNRDDARFCENCGTSLSEYHDNGGSGTAETESAVHPANSEQSSTGAPAYPDQHSMQESAPKQTVYGTEQRRYQETGRAGYNTQYTDAQRGNGQTEYRPHIEAGGAQRTSGQKKPDKTPFIIIGTAVVVIAIAAGVFLATDNPIKKMLSGSDHEYEIAEDEDEWENEEESYDNDSKFEDSQINLPDVFNTGKADGGDRFLGQRGLVSISKLEDDRYHVYIERTAGDAFYRYYMQGTYEPGGVTYDGQSLDCINIDKGICYYTVGIGPQADTYSYYITADDDFYLYFGTDGRLYVYDFALREDYAADDPDSGVSEPYERYYFDEYDYDPYAQSLDSSNIIFTDASCLYDLGLTELQKEIPDDFGETSYIVQEGNYDNTGRSAFDEDVSTSWQVDNNNGMGEDVYCLYNEDKNVDVITLNLGNWRSDELYDENDRPASILIRLWDRGGDKFTDICVSFPDQKKEYAIVLPHTYKAYEIDFQIIDYYPGTVYSDNCISEISVYSK